MLIRNLVLNHLHIRHKECVAIPFCLKLYRKQFLVLIKCIFMHMVYTNTKIQTYIRKTIKNFILCFYLVILCLVFLHT